MRFNGIDMSGYFTINNIVGRGITSNEVSTTNVQGMAGAYVTDKRRPIRIIDIDITVQAPNSTDLRAKIDEINRIFNVNEPVPIVFDDEPDKTYYGIPEMTSDSAEFVTYYQGTLAILCPDPYKYGPEKTVDFSNTASFNVEGTADTEPVVEVTLKADTNYIVVSNETEQLNMVGKTVSTEQRVVEKQTRIFKSTANNLIGWTNSSAESIEEVPMTGKLLTNGNQFYVSDYGTDPTYWHGPAMKTSLSAPVQDFMFDVGVAINTTGDNQAGLIMVFLLDANNVPVARWLIGKRDPALPWINLEARAGNMTNKHAIFPEGQIRAWKNYGGILRICRVGKRWTARAYENNAGRLEASPEYSWVDEDLIANQPVTQVQARILQRANYPTIGQQIDDIDVLRINNLSEGQVPILAKAGDIITFDHERNNILRNGESIITEKAFIGEYFKLKPGQNSLALGPTEAISSTEVRYRPKWR